jgi:hypothetical protein
MTLCHFINNQTYDFPTNGHQKIPIDSKSLAHV